MNDLSLGRRRFALALPLVVAACGASPEPNYYTIVSRTGPTLPRGPKVVLLKDIGLASYLDRLLPQLTDAARSIRALTDLLSRHPEALIKGRTNTGKE